MQTFPPFIYCNFTCTPENTKTLLPCSLSLQESDKAMNVVILPYLVLFSPHYPALREFKSNCMVLWEMSYFPPCNYYTTDEMLLASLYSPAFTMANVLRSYILLSHTSSDFTAKNCHVQSSKSSPSLLYSFWQGVNFTQTP